MEAHRISPEIANKNTGVIVKSIGKAGSPRDGICCLGQCASRGTCLQRGCISTHVTYAAQALAG